MTQGIPALKVAAVVPAPEGMIKQQQQQQKQQTNNKQTQQQQEEQDKIPP